MATPSQQNGTYRPGIPLLDQRPSHSGSRACDREIVCCFTSLPRDLASTSRMAGLWWDLLVWTGPLMTPRYSPIGIPCGIRISPFWISGPATTALCRLLNAITIAFRPRFPPRHGRSWPGRAWVVWHPSTRPARRGFLLHAVTRLHRPRVISTSRGSATLCHLPALGSPPRFSALSSPTAFDDRAGGLPWVRRTTSPYPVQLHVSSVLRISGLA